MKYFFILFIANYFFCEFLVQIAAYPQENLEPNNATLDRTKRGFLDARYESLFALAVAALYCRTTPEQDIKHNYESCTIDVRNLDHNHALILHYDDHSKYVYPDDNHLIHFGPNDPVFLSCANEDNYFIALNGNVRSKTFICVCDFVFADGHNDLHNFYHLSCKDLPERSIIDKGYIKQNPEYHKYQIGFQTDGANFLNLIDVIFKDRRDSTYYVKSTVSKHIFGGQEISKKMRKPKQFDQKFCCDESNLDMNKMYSEDSQIKSLILLLAGQTNVDRTKRYIVPHSDLIFNRGHLTPKAANVYITGAAATFAYLNVAPQWKGINNANWGSIETHVISMVKQLRTDLIVYTGTYGDLYLKDIKYDDQFKQMYLHADVASITAEGVETIVKHFPIPKFFFKVIISPDNDAGIVFVTVNNPHLDIQNKEELKEYTICKKPFTQIKGVMMPSRWKPNNPKLGYSYMCSVIDFARSTGWSPVEGEYIWVKNVLHITLQDSKLTQDRVNEIVNGESVNENPGTSGINQGDNKPHTHDEN